MPSLEEMRGLGQEIVASHRSRKGAIVSLKGETRKQLAGYRSEHRAMGKEVRAELAKAKAQLKAETKALVKELAEGSKARRMGLRIQLTGFHKDHQAMGEEVRADLAKTTKARRQDVRSQLRGYGTEMKGVRAEFVAARTGWQEGLGAAPSERKPRPSAPPKARSKSRRPPSR